MQKELVTKLRAPIDLVVRSLEILNRSTIYRYKEMTKDVSMLVHLTYSVVDAFQAHRLFPFALSPCPLIPSPFPSKAKGIRSIILSSERIKKLFRSNSILYLNFESFSK